MRFLIALALLTPALAGEFATELKPFLEFHCYDCHGDGSSKGDLDFDTLSTDLSDPATFATWEQVFDRVASGEMPPAKVKVRPTPDEKSQLASTLAPVLTKAHAAHKGTVLRRLNRIEYQNTLNDLLGTNLPLAERLPADGRSGEFDTVGEALGISVEQMQRYLDTAAFALNASLATTVEKPASTIITSRYGEHDSEGKFLGKTWGQLDDGSVVLYRRLGYPTGLLRTSGVPATGRYRVTIHGYAHQSEQPITFSLGAMSYARGSSILHFGYHQLPPGKPVTLTRELVLPRHYMLQLEPWGLPNNYDFWKNDRADHYPGPGLAIQKVELEGPLHHQWPSPGHHLLFDGLTRTEIQPHNPKDKLKSWYKPRFEIQNDPAEILPVLKRLATTAFRRPLNKDELAPFQSLFNRQLTHGASFEEALLTAATAIFTSPHFLFLHEPEGPLNNHALATRLSYFLTRTTPDRTLIDLANQGSLNKETRSQTERLLNDDRLERFITDFTDSWLDLRDIDATAPDKTLYPEFDAYLQHSMVAETRAYFRHLITANLPVRNLVKSHFAFLNERLAEHYQLPPVPGPDIQKVSLPSESVRGGILTQGSILKVSANGTNTSPVTRGVWVMERILGQTPTPPPPGISGVEPDIRGATTLRELLAKHRESPSCNSCHQKIDPPGFALESFNPIGGFRDRFRSLGEGERVNLIVADRKVRYKHGPPVDSTGQLPDGRPFENFHQFRDLLAQQEDTLARSLVTKLLTFATGREMGFSDRPEIEKILTATRADHHRVRDLIHHVTQSSIFLSK